MAQTYVVRYGRMRFLGEYTRACRIRIMLAASGSWCAVIVGPSWERFSARLRTRLPGTCRIRLQGEILRLATAEDCELESPARRGPEATFATCQELITKRRLQMDLVDVEIIHGRERVVFYYLAEKRVDFRELVKDLARVLRNAHRDASDRRSRRGEAAG